MTDTLSTDKKLCECGCGQSVVQKYRWYTPRFKHGHHRKGLKNTWAPKAEKCWNWKGGRFVHSSGYIVIRKPEHPRADMWGYVYEHIVILEQKIGRYLEPHEVVHHINENKQDNRPENLELLTRAQHTRFHSLKYRHEDF